jgi:glycosyltransferase involved in cell wall biosynthesis
MTKLSIITINFNNCKGLQKTINSIVAQTFRDFEWIVIDGGSTDGSRELVEHNSKHFSYWVSEPDDGVYQAMNKGIRKAKGEYVVFMNSGDCFADPEVLEDVSKELDCDIVAGFAKEDVTNDVINPPVSFTPWYLLRQNVPHQAEFIKLRLFDSIALYSEDMKVLADYEFNLRASLANVSYKTLRRQIAVVEPGGMSNTRLDLLNKEGKLFRERNLPKAILKDYSLWLNDNRLSSYPSVRWAFEKKWPIKILNYMYKYLHS